MKRLLFITLLILTAGTGLAAIRKGHWYLANSLPNRNQKVWQFQFDGATYHDDNELATVDSMPVTEDYNGNLTDGPLTNDNFVTYHFDARNRLLDAGGVTNFYDGMNNRIGQTYGTNSIKYVVNPNAKLPQVLMRIKDGITNYYVYGKGLLYQVTETANGETTLTYHYDYRGSTIAPLAEAKIAGQAGGTCGSSPPGTQAQPAYGACPRPCRMRLGLRVPIGYGYGCRAEFEPAWQLHFAPRLFILTEALISLAPL